MPASTTASPSRAPAGGNVIDLTWPRALVVAVAGALAGGQIEFGAHELGKHLGRNSVFNPQMTWMAPLANLAVTVPLIMLLAVVLRRRRPALAFPAALGMAVVLAALPTGLLFRPGVHGLAIILLCAGLGSVAARMAGGRPLLFWWLTRAVTAVLLACCLLTAGLLNALRARGEASAMDALPPAADDAPNVPLLVLDTVRGMSLSVNGYERPTTPHLEALARDGVRFTRAVSTASWTLPSHASMFTGRYPHELSASWGQPLDDADPVLAEVFDRLGYVSGGFAANLAYCSTAFGLQRGFQTYRDYLVTPGEAVRSSNLTRALVDEVWAPLVGSVYESGRPSARDVADRFLGWQARTAPRRHPFFAFLNFFDAHGPYAPPAPFDTLFLGRQPVTREPGGYTRAFSPAEVADLKAAYEGAIAYLDSELGRLFDELARRGVLDNTIVIVTADHGEEFSEHGFMGHGDGLYFPSLYVPLVVRFPRSVPRGARIDAPVTLRDLAATIEDLAGVPSTGRLPGQSLAWRWGPAAGSGVATSPILSEARYAKNLPAERPVSKGDLHSLVDDGVHFIRRGDGEEELYDIVRDPAEQAELSRLPGNASLAGRIRDALRALVPFATERR
jgi:arylsulfatase A-like enzyme